MYHGESGIIMSGSNPLRTIIPSISSLHQNRHQHHRQSVVGHILVIQPACQHTLVNLSVNLSSDTMHPPNIDDAKITIIIETNTFFNIYTFIYVNHFYLNSFFRVLKVRYTTRTMAMIQMYHLISYQAAIAPSLIPVNRVLENWIISLSIHIHCYPFSPFLHYI